MCIRDSTKTDDTQLLTHDLASCKLFFLFLSKFIDVFLVFLFGNPFDTTYEDVYKRQVMEVPLIFQMKPFSISRFREISLPFISDKTEAGSVLEPFRVMEMVSFSLETLIRSLTASQPFFWKLPSI